jgi:hypothetical protein
VDVDFSSLEQDARTVLFFKEIYNKLDYYFKLVRSYLNSTLSKMLIDVEEEINRLEREERVINEYK